MRIVSDNIKNALAKPTTQRKGRIFVNEQYYDVYNVDYYANGYDEGQVIGNAIATQLDFDIPFMPKFDKFKYYDGIFTGNEYEYVDMGTFIVFDEKDNDEFTKHITAFDNLINFNAPFVPKGPYPKRLYNELKDICEQANVELENTEITNGNFMVDNNQFTSGESLKTVLKSILAISGDIAIIKNDKLKLILETPTDFSMGRDQHEPMDWKRKSYGINQVIIGDSQVEGEYVVRQDDEDISKNGVHKLVIYDNLFAYTEDKRNALVDGLFNKVKGFGYLPYELKGEWINYLEIGDIITIDGNETRVLRINGKSPNALDSEMSAPAIIDSSIEFLNNTDNVGNQLRRTERIVDKANQTITDVVSQVSEYDEKISQVTQTVDELKQQIQNTISLTIEGQTLTGTLDIDNVFNGEPLNIKIHPIYEHIDLTYPTHTIYPSDSTFTRVKSYLKIEEKDGKYSYEYDMPELLYLDDDHYDEFEIDYKTQKCFKTKRIDFDETGMLVILDTPQIVDYEYPYFNLVDGNYKFSLEDGYSNGYIYGKFVGSNDYTTLFATKVELNTAITQTQDSITTEVGKVTSLLDTEVENLNSKIDQTVDTITSEVSRTYATKDELGNYSTTEEMNSAIKQSADNIQASVSGQITDLDGKVQNVEGSLDLYIKKKDTGEVVSAFNLASNEVTINSNNFTLTAEGDITAHNATLYDVDVSGGDIELTTSGQSARFYIRDYDDYDCYWSQSARVIHWYGTSGGVVTMQNNLSSPIIGLKNTSYGYTTSMSANGVYTGNIENNENSGSFDLYLRSNNGVWIITENTDTDIVYPSGRGVYLRKEMDGTPHKIQTTAGAESSLNLKKNLELFNQAKYDEAIELLRNIDIYDYEYKYNIYDTEQENKKNYGFIIDYVEAQKNADKFFRFNAIKGVIDRDNNKIEPPDKREIPDDPNDIINYKEYDDRYLVKYLLTICKAQQKQIDELNEKVNMLMKGE